jgi:hypothetical protein
VIRYIGSIYASDVTRPRPMSLDRFWGQVDSALDELGVHGSARLAMETMIATTVPRPEPELVERTRQEFEAWRGGMQSMLRSMAANRRPRRSRTASA